MIYSVTATDCAGPNSPCMLKGDLIQCIDHAKRLGFNGVELHMRNPELNDYSELRNYANENGIKITTIGTGAAFSMDGYNLTADDIQTRKDAEKILINFLRAAKDAGGAKVMLGLMKGKCKDKDFDAYKDMLFESLKPVVEAAEKYQCEITIEAICRFWTNCLCTVEETLDFVNRFDSQFVTIHLDTFHLNIEEKDIKQSVELCQGKLGHVHLADSNRMYPGSGHFDFMSFFKALNSIGYLKDGIVAFEYDAKPNGIVAAQKGLNYIQNITSYFN